MRLFVHILSVLVFLSAFKLSAQNSECVHGIGVNVRPSYIMPTHGFYNGYNPSGRPLRTGGSLHLAYSFSYLPDSRLGKDYPGAYQGVGIGAQTFLAHDYLGTPISLYLFQGAPFVRLSENLTLGYEWNLGLSAGWKTGQHLLTGSRLNIYINVGIFADWKINRNWSLQFGPEYTHYSNGDTTFPNGGANTVNFRIGARRYFNDTDYTYDSPHIFKMSDDNRDIRTAVTYDMMIYGAWRADRMLEDYKLYLINDKFLIAGLQFNPLYHLNKSLSFGPSLDLMYDRSADLIAVKENDGEVGYVVPSFSRQVAAGLSIRGELRMPIFAVNVGAGYNFTMESGDLRGLYGIFVLKAFLTDSIYLNVGYRLSTVLYSHNLMFGLGWRIFNENRAITH